MLLCILMMMCVYFLIIVYLSTYVVLNIFFKFFLNLPSQYHIVFNQDTYVLFNNKICLLIMYLFNM